VLVTKYPGWQVRIKTMRGRGGGVEDVLYENLHGSTVAGIQLTENYHSGAAAVGSILAAVLTEIYLCDVCSCQKY
jgi:hypothetical protein